MLKSLLKASQNFCAAHPVLSLRRFSLVVKKSDRLHKFVIGYVVKKSDRLHNFVIGYTKNFENRTNSR